MTIITCDIGISVDGYGAGPNQSLEHPLGENGEELLHRWMLDEREQHADVLARITEASAFVMGRNMFSPGRGPHDPSWKGWWGDEPPYHAPVFVVTHHEREPLPMEGGTTFHFVTDGLQSAVAQAREAAGDGSVSICGGVSTINQALKAGFIDELRLHVATAVLGGGERLFDGVGPLDVELVERSGTDRVTHLTYRIRR